MHVCGFPSYYLTNINYQCFNLLCDSPSLAVTMWSHCWALRFCNFLAQLATPTPHTRSRKYHSGEESGQWTTQWRCTPSVKHTLLLYKYTFLLFDQVYLIIIIVPIVVVAVVLIILLVVTVIFCAHFRKITQRKKRGMYQFSEFQNDGDIQLQ